MKPVMYLDVDDTLLSMHERYYPAFKQVPASTWRHYGYAPPGGREFLLWALDTHEVRWLTWWCPGGEMAEPMVARLEEEFQLSPGTLAHVRSARFARGGGRCHKTDGIDWQEHEAGRPWIWVEDWISDHEQQVLRGRGCLDRWHPCHVTEDPHALQRLHAHLLDMRPSAPGDR